MKNSILNLEGVQVLSRNEQKSVNGGKTQTCRFTVTMNGETRTNFQIGYPDGQAGSNLANSNCVAVLANTAATACRYDCAWDDMGN